MSDGITSNTVCGREYKVVQSHDLRPPKTFYMDSVETDDGHGQTIQKKVKRERKSFYIKPKPKFLVDGIMHPGGQKQIRFKSLDRAENYIKNFRLEK